MEIPNIRKEIIPNIERQIIEIETFADLYDKKVYKPFNYQELNPSKLYGCFFCLCTLEENDNAIFMTELIEKNGAIYNIKNFFHKNCIEFYIKYKSELDRLLLKRDFKGFTSYFKLNYYMDRLRIDKKKLFNFPKFN